MSRLNNRTKWAVRKAEGKQDAFFLQRIWHHWFGAEYRSPAVLQTDLFDIAGWTLPEDADTAPKESFGVIAEHRTREQTVRIGGGVVLLLGHEQTVEELPDGRFNAEELAGDINAWFLLNAVDQAWRGEGIGSELLQRRLEWAKGTDAEMAFACGWERDNRPTSRPLLESAGFTPVQRIKEMYTESDRSACPDCGVWPSDDKKCRCDATVWAMDMDSQQ